MEELLFWLKRDAISLLVIGVPEERTDIATWRAKEALLPRVPEVRSLGETPNWEAVLEITSLAEGAGMGDPRAREGMSPWALSREIEVPVN